MSAVAVEQQPTIEGYAPGVIALDPMALQCRDCGAVVVNEPGQGVGYFVIRSGFHFHGCERGSGMRRCPECLARVEAECPNTGRHGR